MAEPEESDGQRSYNQDSDSYLRGDEKKSSSRPDSSTSGRNTYTIPSPTDVQSTTGRPAEPPLLKLDERQRLARERREEREKQNAVREAQWLEREERARQFYEKQLEERRRRLEEQRRKEDKRRAAVEEKRQQKLQEEKARYEAVMRRTLEKSQRARPKSNRWSWGGVLTTSTSHNSDADRRSVSTMNLSKHTDPVITKRLSSSSATLLNSPDRGMRRMPLTPWESTVINRLQTPTHSYLARSRSAMSLSGDAVTPVCPRSASCHPMSSLSFKSLQSRSTERPIRAGLSLERPIRAGYVGPETIPRRKTTHNMPIDRKDKDYVRKSWSNLSYPTPALTMTPTKRAPSPGSQRGRATQSSTKTPQKLPVSKKSRSPPPPASLPLSPSNPSLSPGNLRPSRVVSEPPRANLEGEKAKKEDEVGKTEAEAGKKPEEARGQEDTEPSQSTAKTSVENTALKAEPAIESVVSPQTGRPSAGTTDPEEASRLLAEKRRQARGQREREEEEKKQQEEAERRHKEEMARRKAEERARREEEAQRLAEEKIKKEEEERRLAEEQLQREREEAERLQKQKEEEEARQREEADRLRQEREKHFQKEEAERLERKKRLEEIMKRTRRSDQKSTTQRNGDMNNQSGQESAPGSPSVSVSSPPAPEASQHSDKNGHTNSSLISHTLPSAGHSVSPEVQLRENGIIMQTQPFEEVIELPIVTKLSRQEGDGEEKDERIKAPLLAFRDNLTTLDDSLTQHNAGDV